MADVRLYQGEPNPNNVKLRSPPVPLPTNTTAGFRRRWIPFAGFIRPIRASGVVVARFPKRIRAVFAKPRPRVRTLARVRRAFGYITRKPPIRRIISLLLVSQTQRRRLFLRTKAQFTRVKGYVTRKPPVRRPIVLLAVQAMRRRLALRTKDQFTHIFGRPTAKPPVRQIRVLQFASKEARRRLFLHTKAKVGKPYGYVTRKPPIRRIRGLLVAVARAQRIRIRAFARFTRVFGRPTRKPPVYPIKVLRAQRRPFTRTKAQLRRPRGAVTVAAIFPKAVLAVLVLARNKALLKGRALRTRIYGYVTRKPPIRPVRVLLAAQAMRRRLALRTRAFFTHVYGKATRKPPIRHIVTVLARLRRPIYLRTLLRRPARSAVVVRFPKRTRAVLAIGRLRLGVRARFTKAYGYITRRPPVRPVRVLHFAADAARRRASLRTKILLFHRPTFPPVPVAESKMVLVSSSFGTLTITGSMRAVS